MTGASGLVLSSSGQFGGEPKSFCEGRMSGGSLGEEPKVGARGRIGTGGAGRDSPTWISWLDSRMGSRSTSTAAVASATTARFFLSRVTFTIPRPWFRFIHHVFFFLFFSFHSLPDLLDCLMDGLIRLGLPDDGRPCLMCWPCSTVIGQLRVGVRGAMRCLAAALCSSAPFKFSPSKGQ